MAEGQSAKYDAFVSYSHAADDLLAPRLQAALQRFAKPWWRRRAMRVFRDESSLSASPHLWGSITEALDGSRWFVLLLSPEAAESEWVNREIEYWKSDPSRRERVLPVLTDGEFGWDGDVVGSAVPQALSGVFDSEPRWVDLRFAKGETQLDLKNPDFAAAVADIASAVRGIPKDELESEEVRQHRRTIRTAWAAGILVLVLGVAASVAAVFAFNEQARANAEADRANQEAARANQEAERANQNAAEAETQRAEAETQRAIAEREATIARSQALVLEAEKALDSDPELSLHLGLAAVQGFLETDQDTAQVVAILRTAIARDRVSIVEDWGGPLAVDPTGNLVALRSGNDLVVREIATGTATLRCSAAVPSGAQFAPDGDSVFVASVSQGIYRCDRSRGLVSLFETPSIFGHPELAVTVDGRYAAWANEETQQIHLVNLANRQEAHLSSPGGDGPSFSPDGRLAVAEFDRVKIIEPTTGLVVSTTIVPGCCLAQTGWSLDGSRIAATGDGGVAVVEADSGRLLWFKRFRSSTEGRPAWIEAFGLVAVPSESGFRLFHSESGVEEGSVDTLGLGFGFGVDFLSYHGIPGTTLVVVGGEPGEGPLVVFDASPLGGSELGGWSSSLPHIAQFHLSQDGSQAILADGESVFIIADSHSGHVDHMAEIPPIAEFAERAAFVNGSGLLARPEESARTWVVQDLITDQIVYETAEDWGIQGMDDDGRLAVIYDERACTFVIVDLRSGNDVSHLVEDCGGAHAPQRKFSFSPSGGLVFGSWEGAVGDVLFDVATGQRVHAGFGGAAFAAFPANESIIAVLTRSGELRVLDVVDGLVGAARLEIPAHRNEPRSLSIAPDGSMAATSSLGEPLRLWDLETGQLLGEFGGDPGPSSWHVAAFDPTEPRLFVASPPGVVRIHTLDLHELIAIAESRTSRQLTDAECEQYPGACDN